MIPFNEIIESEVAILGDNFVASVFLYSKVKIGASIDQPRLGGLGFLLVVGEGVLVETFVGLAVGLVVGRGRPLLTLTQYAFPTLILL